MFTPAVDFLGDATFKYKVNDGLVDSAEHTVTLHLAALDDGVAPISITGVAATGGTLSALIGTDPDGPWSAATYDWFRDGISGCSLAFIGVRSGDLEVRLVHASDVESFAVTSRWLNRFDFVRGIDRHGPVGMARARRDVIYQVWKIDPFPNSGREV